MISRPARRALVPVIVAGLAGLLPAQAGAAEPAGWRPVYSEAFDPPAAGCAAFTGPAAQSYDLPDEVTVSDGFLRLHVHRRTYQSFTFTSGSVRCAATIQQYGRYEFRARAAGAPGIASYVALSAAGAAAPDQSRLDLVVTRTGVREVLHNGHGTGTSERTVDTAGTDFHTYILEWAPSGFRVYVDGAQELLDAHVSTAQRTIGFGVGPADGLSAPTALPAEFAVDYLRVWAYDPTSSPAPTASPSAAVAARTSSARVGRHLWAWLIGSAVAALLVAVLALGAWRTRPHRPRPGHRA